MNPFIKQEIKLDFSCHVGSEQMTSTQGGSFCHQCSKKVHDMVDKSREEVLAMIAAHPEGICGKMSPDQFDHTLIEKLVLRANRPLRTWEIWLLALIFSFWFPLGAWGQSGKVSAVDLTEIEASLEASVAGIAGNCDRKEFAGIINLKREYFYRLDSLVNVVEKRGNRGIEIIILKPFIYFHNGSDGWEGPGGGELGLMSHSLADAIVSLDSIIDFPWKVVNVHGHAGVEEIGDDHEGLALRRAQLVAGWLKRAGLPNTIRVRSFGHMNPNEYPNEEGAAFQPRVEIIMSED